MPSIDSSVDKTPSRGRRQSAGTEKVTSCPAETRHDFQARGSVEHLKRLAAAKEQGYYGVILNVRHSDWIAHWGTVV
jgi:hypothetical protein